MSYTTKERRDILFLQKRLAWLKVRYAETGRDFHGQEIRAIEWMLSELEKCRGPFPAEVQEKLSIAVRKLMGQS